MTNAKNVNYTPEMVAQMIEQYEQLGNDGLPEIAEMLGKTVRSIRSKLVREGVYVATPKTVKAKIDAGPTKKELLNQLEMLVPFEVSGLSGATKSVLVDLIAFADR